MLIHGRNCHTSKKHELLIGSGLRFKGFQRTALMSEEELTREAEVEVVSRNRTVISQGRAAWARGVMTSVRPQHKCKGRVGGGEAGQGVLNIKFWMNKLWLWLFLVLKKRRKPWFLNYMQNGFCWDKIYFIFTSVWLYIFQNNYIPGGAVNERLEFCTNVNSGLIINHVATPGFPQGTWSGRGWQALGTWRETNSSSGRWVYSSWRPGDPGRTQSGREEVMRRTGRSPSLGLNWSFNSCPLSLAVSARLCPASHRAVMCQLLDGSAVQEGSGISAESALKQLCPFPGHSKNVHTTRTKRRHCERAANRKQIDSTQKHAEAFHMHSPVLTWGIRASFLRLSWQALRSEGPFARLKQVTTCELREVNSGSFGWLSFFFVPDIFKWQVKISILRTVGDKNVCPEGSELLI